MTHFERVTREEVARSNDSEGATRAYLRTLHDLAAISNARPSGSRPRGSARSRAKSAGAFPIRP